MTLPTGVSFLSGKSVASMLVLILLILTPLSAEDGSGGWQYRRTLSEVKIFHRDSNIPGIHEFLATTVIESTPEKIESIVLDINSNSRWMSDCILSLPLQRFASGEIIAYYVTAPPWPVGKRDSVVKIIRSYSKGKIVFTMSSLPEGTAESYMPVNPSCVRIYRMEGSVILESAKGGSTEIRLSVAGAPGGYVPGFIIDLGGWMIPYKTLTGLKRFIGELNTNK